MIDAYSIRWMNGDVHRIRQANFNIIKWKKKKNIFENLTTLKELKSLKKPKINEQH